MLDEPVGPGDYVLNYAGCAIRCIPPDEVAEMLALYERLIELAEQDRMIADGLARARRPS
jgi:hydrogenase maturation factor